MTSDSNTLSGQPSSAQLPSEQTPLPGSSPRSNARRVLVHLLALTLAFVSLYAVQHRIDRVRGSAQEDELRYMPNEKILSHCTAGMDSVAADLLWLQCIKYIARHYKTDQDFPWLYHMMTLVTRLDPYFKDAYHYAGVFLSALKVNPDAAIEILKTGSVKCPDAWELPYEIAMIYLMELHDKPDAQKMAARYFAMAVETGHAPEYVAYAASNLSAENDMDDVEETMWRETLNNDNGNKVLKELAARKLIQLDNRRLCKQLDQAVQVYTQRLGHAPTKLSDLVADKIIDRIPPDALGGQFFLAKNGKVLNTSILDEVVADRERDFGRIIQRFHQQKGRWPASLQELIDLHYVIPPISPHPYPGEDWKYNPQTGEFKG